MPVTLLARADEVIEYRAGCDREHGQDRRALPGVAVQGDRDRLSLAGQCCIGRPQQHTGDALAGLGGRPRRALHRRFRPVVPGTTPDAVVREYYIRGDTHLNAAGHRLLFDEVRSATTGDY